MRKLIRYALVPPCLLAAAACAPPDAAPLDPGLRHTVVLRYQHVANVHRIDFSTPLALPGRAAPVHAVLPLEAAGFWAVFVLCGVDAAGAGIPGFYFDVGRWRLPYGGRDYGPLRPYTLRLDDTADLNSRADTPAVRAAIGAEIENGPPTQLFRHGDYPRLTTRFAIYVPRALPDYAGGRLPLRYENARTLVLGKDAPPADIPAAGADGSGIAAQCLP